MNTTTESKGARKIRKVRARISADAKHIGLAYMILDLPLVETMRTGTMATDGRSVFFNPHWTETISEDEVQTVLLHEADHIASLHHVRMGDRDIEGWNYATDYSINGGLVRSGFKVPSQMLWHDEHSTSGKSCEYIYRKMAQEAPPQPEDSFIDGGYPGMGQAEGGSEDGDTDQGGSEDGDTDQGGSEDGGGDGQDEDDADDSGGTKPPTGGGNNSEAPDGPVGADAEEDKVIPNFAGIGEVWPAPDDVNREEEVRDVMERLAQAVVFEKAVGQGAGGLCEKILDGHHEPEAWDFLREYLTDAFSPLHTWRRPNRRYVHQGVYLPGRETAAGTLHIAVDTSGSVSHNELKTYLSNVRGIAEQVGVHTLKIAYIDWIVHRDEDGCAWQEIDVQGGDDIDFLTKGGGGTTFDPIFTDIEDTFEEVECLIYMTDGWGSITVPDPGFPVVWLSSGTTPHGHSWGEIVDISKSRLPEWWQ
tara:strand:- start:2021 stop:3445 length:1425 start_codon:yes stop_codon:yes gene_type:complete